MSQDDIKHNLFKFISLRPPQTVAKDTEEEGFAKDQRSESDSEVIKKAKQVRDAGGDDRELADEIKKLIIEKNYGPDLPDDAPYSKIKKIVTTMKDAGSKIPSDAHLNKEVEKALGSSAKSYVESGEFKAVTAGVWERLYAFSLVNRAEPAKTENFVSALRALQLVQFLAEGKDLHREQIGRIFKSRPIVPPIFANDAIRQTKYVPKVATKTETPEKKQIEGDLKRLVTLNGAAQEIRRLSNESALNFVKEAETEAAPTATPSPRKGTQVLPESATRPNVRFEPSSATAPKPWAFGKPALDKMTANTKTTLRELGYSLDQSSVHEILNGLQRKMTDLTERLLIKKDFAGAELPEGLEDVPGSRLLGSGKDKRGSTRQGSGGAGSLDLPAPGTVRPLGIGDLKVVKQVLKKYRAGEVAHIENVLKGENKSRTHRRLDKSEDTLVTSEETSTETEKDLETTERFELKKEAEKTIQTDMSMQSGVTVSGSYGPVQVSAQANFSLAASVHDSQKTSSNYAKEIVERSLSKVQEKKRTERTQKLTTEIEEINVHGIDNNDGQGHVTGIYRWVDKLYSAQIYNYGRRLMFEFIVPEPAAYYIYSQNNKPRNDILVTRPDEIDFTHKDIQPTNYYVFVRKYNADNVSPPPAEISYLSTAINIDAADGKKEHGVTNKELSVPAGYTAQQASVTHSYTGFQNLASYMAIIVGDRYLSGTGSLTHLVNMAGESGVVPVSVHALNVSSAVVNVELKCQLTDQEFENWQLKTYSAILLGYKAMLSNYQEALAARETRQGIVISGQNPLINRSTEKLELKKACITMLTEQAFADFHAMQDNAPEFGYPEIDVLRARSEGKYIQFFEQGFEWEQITYLFYPYFWGKKENWIDLSNINDNDPLFTQFLQAGAARVVVPVDPAYNDAILYYLQTRKVWNGGDAPVIGDQNDLYKSIVEELRNAQDDLEGASPEGEPWEVVVPTSLVYLQQESTLPDFSQPTPQPTP